MAQQKKLDDLYSWIVRGQQRKAVLLSLSEGPETAQVIRKRMNARREKQLSLREMSRHLTTFTDKDLVESLAPDAPYSKPYRLTKTGKEVRDLVKKYG